MTSKVALEGVKASELPAAWRKRIEAKATKLAEELFLPHHVQMAGALIGAYQPGTTP